jgi:hypothetical protein
VGGSGVVSGVGAILRKWDRVGHLVRHFMDGDREPNAVQELNDAMIEVGDGSRLQRQFARLTPAGAHDEAMADKVKFGFEDFAVGRDRRRSKTSRGDVERNLPAMVEPGGQHQPDLADNLGPELQCCGGVAPGGIGQIGPNGGVHGTYPNLVSAEGRVIGTPASF